MIYGVDHISITVSNMTKSIEFYSRVLGMDIVDRRNPQEASYYWLRIGPSQDLSLSLNPQMTPKALGTKHKFPDTPHFALLTSREMINVLEKQLKQEKVEITRIDDSIYFFDPDENEIEITCWRENELYIAGKSHW